MKFHLLGILLLVLCSVASAQTQSGSSIGENSGSGGRASANTPAPLPPVPSTGPSPESAVTQSRPTRVPQTSGGESPTSRSADTSGRSHGRCDTLTNEERAQCLREQASTGTAGGGSAGASSGATR
jgi:hypothetical protein